MYVGGARGYNTGVVQTQTGVIDYVPTDSWGNNDSVNVQSSFIDYMILQEIGYYTNVENVQTGVVDYNNLEGYYKDVVNIQTGIVDYILDNIPVDIIIQQERGWTFNWELITSLWETIDNNWNN